jgi:predicted P-loop ATPase
MRISDVMTRLGWTNKRRVWPDSDGERERRWIREDGDAPSASRVKEEGDDGCPF